MGWGFGGFLGLRERSSSYINARGRLAPRRSSFFFTLCVFARQFWFSVLQPLNLAHVMPSRSISSFAEWWRRSWKKIPKQLRKGFNSLCILGAWTLWKHRNARVFDGGLQVCSKHSRLSRMILSFGIFLGLRGLLPWTQEGC